MREIKFRVWCRNRNEWEKDICFIGLDGDVYQQRFASPVMLPVNKKNHIIMQYTGLKDKNGVEIYEGDICIVDEGLSDYWYVVEWVYGGFQAVTYKKKGSNVRGIADGVNSFYIEPNEASVMTVIGNVHENPELLEVQNDWI